MKISLAKTPRLGAIILAAGMASGIEEGIKRRPLRGRSKQMVGFCLIPPTGCRARQGVPTPEGFSTSGGPAVRAREQMGGTRPHPEQSQPAGCNSHMTGQRVDILELGADGNQPVAREESGRRPGRNSPLPRPGVGGPFGRRGPKIQEEDSWT